MTSHIMKVPSFGIMHEEESSVAQSTPDIRKTWESFSWSSPSDPHVAQSDVFARDLNASLRELLETQGFIAAAVANTHSGKTIASLVRSEHFNIKVAAIVNSHVIHAKREAIEALGMSDTEHIEDILVTLPEQYHLIRPCANDPSLFFYLALDRELANLAMARHNLCLVEQSIAA